jgi:hypothetical protein
MMTQRKDSKFWTSTLVTLFLLNFTLLWKFGREQKELHLKFLPGKNLICFEKAKLKRLSKRRRIFHNFRGVLGQTYFFFSCQNHEKPYPGEKLGSFQLQQEIQTYEKGKVIKTLCFQNKALNIRRAFWRTDESCYLIADL